MDKVFKAIGRFFKKIWEWIRSTAWVQPLLIVGIIFGIIFSINPIVNAVKGAVNADDTGKFYEKHLVCYRDLYKGIDGQKDSYKSAEKLNSKSGTVLVIYVTDESLEAEIASFYTTKKDVTLYIVNFSKENNQKSKWDSTKKEYVDDDAAYFYDDLLTKLQEKYDGLSDEGEWRNNYSKEFMAKYGYSVFYPGFNKDDTYQHNSSGHADASTSVKLPAAVKYVNGEISDMRLGESGGWTCYAQSGKTLTNYQVLSDLWEGA